MTWANVSSKRSENGCPRRSSTSSGESGSYDDTQKLLMSPVIDPRLGDLEDDASSTKARSMFSLLGSLLAEISFPKLVWSFTVLFILPGLLLGLTPLIASAWVGMVSRKILSPLLGIWPLLVLLTVLAIGLFGARALLRTAESSFWSLNSLVVEPLYLFCREGLRHLIEKLLRSRIGVPGPLWSPVLSSFSWLRRYCLSSGQHPAGWASFLILLRRVS
jgi:hypothetical protein